MSIRTLPSRRGGLCPLARLPLVAFAAVVVLSVTLSIAAAEPPTAGHAGATGGQATASAPHAADHESDHGSGHGADHGDAHADPHGDAHGAPHGGDHATGHGDDHGGHGGAPHVNGGELALIWGVPFVGMLLSIAVFPLVAPHFWHHRYGAVAGFWAVSFLGPFILLYGADVATYEFLHVMLLDYVPFLILLGTLFTVAGGVRVKGSLVGSPVVNTGILGLGTVLASLMGTTGAAMLLIRPLLRANENRRWKTHVVVFFIFLVANIGGSLTPLGDPPLFLGFLNGVEFFWVTTNMFLPMVVVAGICLVIFFVVDTVLVKIEQSRSVGVAVPASVGAAAVADAGPPDEDGAEAQERLGLEGKVNLLLLLGVVGAVLLQGVWNSGIAFDVYHVPIKLESLVSQAIMIAIASLSLQLTPWASRVKNGFTWFPIIEVAKLFAGIFVTIVPALAMLKAGVDGPLGGIVSLVTVDGQPVNYMYFWLTGILSSFLDNAPTYLVFFNTAGGDAETLMYQIPTTLLAISAGAVFMGANTYIGNAPNFMVKAIAEESRVPMPSFFGYMVWSFGILGPLFVLTTFLFFL